MRFVIALKPLENKIPISNRNIGMSLIKAAIKIENEELFNDMFFYGDKKNKKIKPIAFSIYINDFKINKNDIDVNGDILINISTPSNRIGLTIFNGIIKLKNKGEFKYKNYSFKLLNIRLLEEKAINTNIIKCKTLSPIYIRDINGKSISIEDKEKFEEGLNYVSNIFLESYRGYGLKERLIFEPRYMKKNVIKEEIDEFKNQTNKQFMFINAFSGVFALKGNVDDLKVLMQSGIGFRRTQGFGLLDLA